MAEETGISWADSTANFWIGCQKVSEACDNCYAEDLMGTEGSRLKRVEWGPGGVRSYCKQGWADVRKWQRAADSNGGVDPKLGRRRRIFVNSLSDFFDNHPSVTWREEAWELIRRSPSLIFMLVTKRPQLIARYLPPFWDEIAERVWLLTTVESQDWADRRIPDLLTSCDGRARAAAFGVSCEPLLGPVDLTEVDDGSAHREVPKEEWGPVDDEESPPALWWNALTGERRIMHGGSTGDWSRTDQSLDWVIVGGESGKEARPMDPAWAVHLRDQCDEAGVAFHFKQWGEWAPAIGTREGDVIFRHPHPDFPGNEAVKLGTTVRRVGKAVAGHLLRGREHREVPCAG